MTTAQTPVFPTPVATPFGDGLMAIGGLTYRQWLIGQALKGLLTNPPQQIAHDHDAVALEAQRYADAVIRLEDQP